MGSQWHDTTSAYGPLWTVTSAGVAATAHDSADTAAWLFKAIAALGSVALVLAAVALAPPGRKAFAAAFVGWNPVLAMQFAGGGHNDTLMMALPLAGMAVAARGRPNLGAAFWPVAIVVKWLPMIFLPLLIARDRKAFGWKGLAISSVVVALISTALYGLALGSRRRPDLEPAPARELDEHPVLRGEVDWDCRSTASPSCSQCCSRLPTSGCSSRRGVGMRDSGSLPGSSA